MLRFAFLLSALIPVAAHAAAKAPPRVGWSADSTLFVSAPKETPFDFARLTSLPMDVQMENPETRALLDLYLNGKTTEDNRARLLINGSNSFAARFELLNGAKKSIYFQTMYWLPDNYGLKLLPIIARKLEEGVVIRIVIDSLSTPAKDFTFYRNVNDYIRSKYRELAPKFPQFADELAKTSKSIWVFKASETGFPAQVIQHDEKGKTLRVVEHFFEDSSMLHIMHHKAIIVDGEKVITGGMNFADNYAYGGKGIHGKKNKRSVKIEDGPEYSDEEIATIRAMLPNYWVNISQHMGEKLKEGRFDPELGWRDT
ncbi:MAG: phospholipase D-like domain-containing protein, partial [Bdellovibrionota bacterium]